MCKTSFYESQRMPQMRRFSFSSNRSCIPRKGLSFWHENSGNGFGGNFSVWCHATRGVIFFIYIVILWPKNKWMRALLCCFWECFNGNASIILEEFCLFPRWKFLEVFLVIRNLGERFLSKMVNYYDVCNVNAMFLCVVNILNESGRYLNC